MKLRIKYLENIGYFGQVKTGLRWKTIGKHPSGYGLYSNSNTDYPMKSQHEALNRCKLYKQWAYHIAQKATYIEDFHD